MISRLPPALLALVGFGAAFSYVSAADALFSDALLRRGQVQTVLEHKPVKQAECRQAVRPDYS